MAMKNGGNQAGCHSGSILLGVGIGWAILLGEFPPPVAYAQPPTPASSGREKPPATVQSADQSRTKKTRLLDLIDSGQADERTSFQTGAVWDPMLQLPSDVAMCYGVGPDLGPRIKLWKDKGYLVHVMTGVAWGNYQDYLYGQFDGKRHVDEAQTDRWGNVISHGGDVYYMCPGPTFGNYLAQRVRAAIDAGASSIHLEEPEFWARAGYSEGFKRAWRTAHGEDWTPPHTSPDAQYRASRLQYDLYRKALKQVFDAVREDNARTGRKTRCYVATHSLINYAHWGIVSPESSLLSVGADGFIAQVWTGTARTPNVYEGVVRERTFETAFLEYGAMVAATRGSPGRLWLLHDPVEDDPDHSWEDYRTNWECTVVASLLWPETARYEVAPWPERVFHGSYPTVDRNHRKPGERVSREPIPAAYATELLTVMNALNDMDQAEIQWDCGTRGIGIVVSDTMMFQRAEPDPSDPHLGSFYGLALPLLERGMPVEPVQLETATIPGNLARCRVLVMTYEGMKPMTPAANQAIADWVKMGGSLVFVDDDRDPYNVVKSWWNRAGAESFRTPRESLFSLLGLPRGAGPGSHAVGKGTLVFEASSPAALSYRQDGAARVRELVRGACAAAKLEYRETNHIVLRRGPYVIGVGLEGPPSDGAHELRGRCIDLFAPQRPIVSSVKLTPGRRCLLYDVDRVRNFFPRVLASTCRTLDLTTTKEGFFRFRAHGPERSEALLRIGLREAPRKVMLDGKPLADDSWAWDDASHLVLLRFPDKAAGRQIVIE
jgi:hypothetical protein